MPWKEVPVFVPYPRNLSDPCEWGSDARDSECSIGRSRDRRSSGRPQKVCTTRRETPVVRAVGEREVSCWSGPVGPRVPVQGHRGRGF